MTLKESLSTEKFIKYSRLMLSSLAQRARLDGKVTDAEIASLKARYCSYFATFLGSSVTLQSLTASVTGVFEKEFELIPIPTGDVPAVSSTIPDDISAWLDGAVPNITDAILDYHSGEVVEEAAKEIRFTADGLKVTVDIAGANSVSVEIKVEVEPEMEGIVRETIKEMFKDVKFIN